MNEFNFVKSADAEVRRDIAHWENKANGYVEEIFDNDTSTLESDLEKATNSVAFEHQSIRRFYLMTFTNSFEQLSTDELVERFKAATIIGNPPRELVDELAIATWHRFY